MKRSNTHTNICSSAGKVCMRACAVHAARRDPEAKEYTAMLNTTTFAVVLATYVRAPTGRHICKPAYRDACTWNIHESLPCPE